MAEIFYRVRCAPHALPISMTDVRCLVVIIGAVHQQSRASKALFTTPLSNLDFSSIYILETNMGRQLELKSSCQIS